MIDRPHLNVFMPPEDCFIALRLNIIVHDYNFAMGQPWEMVRPQMLRLAIQLSDVMRDFGLTPPSETVLLRAVFITLVSLILGTLFASYSLFATITRDPRDSVLLVGICGESDLPSPGKTTLFNTIRNGSPPRYGCVPSMQTNEAVFAPSAHFSRGTRADTPVRWVDVPGHPRVRTPELAKHIPRARCVVFVIDATAFSTSARRDATLLHDVLVHQDVVKRATPVLIFCNKSDLTNAASPAAVKARLQAELERARIARNAGLTSVKGDKREEDEVARLGFDNTPFVFDHTFGPVSFAAGSALTKEVMPVINFVRSSFL